MAGRINADGDCSGLGPVPRRARVGDRRRYWTSSEIVDPGVLAGVLIGVLAVRLEAVRAPGLAAGSALL